MSKKLAADFTLYSKVYDYGQRINKIEIDLPYSVNSDDLSLNTFKVTTENKLDHFEINNGERIIKNIYIKGNKDTSNKLILQLDASLNAAYSSTLFFDEENFTNRPLNVNYHITQVKEIGNNESVKKFQQVSLEDEEVDLFTEGKLSSKLHYRDYQPKDQSQNHPLIIWLHGAGEGGEDNEVHITANRGAIAFIDDQVQEIFDDPYILAPQTASFWIPEFTLEDGSLHGENQTDDLIQLIEEYIDAHPKIDADRVYIGGASMGGYQVWETIFQRSDLFAAAFPIATAYKVPEEKLDKIKNMPIWITHAEEDEVVPFENSQAAFKALSEKGGKVIFTQYKDIKIGNEPFSPHASWIYVLNNLPTNEKGTTIFQWLSTQNRSKNN